MPEEASRIGGPSSPHEPRAAVTPAAKQHLADAIASYRAALERKADDLFSLIGLAWSSAEAGRKEEAITTYRKAHGASRCSSRP
jgi:hypothetical protein